LGDRPLGTVRRPDADPLALVDAEGDQRPGGAVDRLPELAISVAETLVAGDERLVVGMLGGGAVEQVADGEAEQGKVARPAGVAPAARSHGVDAHWSSASGSSTSSASAPMNWAPRAP